MNCSKACLKLAALLAGIIPGIAFATGNSSTGLDLSIEGMRSQNWGIGVFIFMLIGVFTFSGIIYAVAFGKFAPKTMKKGEKAMIIAVILGTLTAVVFGGIQLLSGYLF